MDDYIPKPIKVDHLLAVLAKWVKPGVRGWAETPERVSPAASPGTARDEPELPERLPQSAARIDQFEQVILDHGTPGKNGAEVTIHAPVLQKNNIY